MVQDIVCTDFCELSADLDGSVSNRARKLSEKMCNKQIRHNADLIIKQKNGGV